MEKVIIDDSVNWIDTTGKDEQGAPLWRINATQLQATLEHLSAYAHGHKIPPLPTVLVFARIAVIAALECNLKVEAVQQWVAVIHRQELALRGVA